MHLICTSVKRQPGRWDKLNLGFISLRFVESALEGTGLRSRTHGNVFLHFCIVPSNELVVLDSLENSKQYKNAGKRFRVYGDQVRFSKSERAICRTCSSVYQASTVNLRWDLTTDLKSIFYISKYLT